MNERRNATERYFMGRHLNIKMDSLCFEGTAFEGKVVYTSTNWASTDIATLWKQRPYDVKQNNEK